MATAAPEAVRIDLGDVQGDILRAYGNAYERTTYVFVGIDEPGRGREWLHGLVDRVTTAAPWADAGKPAHAMNVAFTAAGLRALGVPDRVLRTFSDEFLQGMAERAGLLGDTGDAAPARWERGFGTGEAHVLVTINALGPTELDAALAELRTEVVRHGLQIVSEQPAQLLPQSREHFGFADGFAQPAVEGVTDDKAVGGGVPLPHGTWRALAPGEFILGYPDEDTRVDPKRRLPNAPAAPLGKSGTYMVWRKLHQDVALFRRTVRDAAQRLDRDELLLRAKIVGRWDDGAPLVTHPDTQPDEFDGRAEGANDFLYERADGDGHRCPLGAHIRRSNPRDALGFEGRLSFRHRIIRRGMPYGDPLPPDALADDGADRGLVFVCFNASISRQFEGIQVQWLNDGNIFGLGHDRDYLLGGTNGGSMVIQGRPPDPPCYLAPQGPFVTTRAGEYLFVPGITALAAIADGVTG
ncbi:Dyp-type peroxidase [Svornostia abyssi]|uniref:Dyp-type peroxidase n=1 Tax=Svornostia abyssi TaxID=2898438 RepID=A0ABY5PMQ3_9ACTN|nr:Dyp-type peroxidase [Parviterribacteraceae bacterium J379]